MRLTSDVLAQDLSWAEWAVRPLDTPWRDGVFVHHHVPRGFPFYARLFHPASLADGTPVRWSDVALAAGKAAHAGMQFEALAAGGAASELYDGEPESGTLPRAQLAAVVEALRGPGPSPCRFLLWEGYAGFHGVTAAAPRVRTHGRAYVGYQAGIDDGSWVEDDHGFGRSPSLWWPEDRRWIVATDVDPMTSFAGLREEADLSALLRHPALECARIDVDARVDVAGDALNRA